MVHLWHGVGEMLVLTTDSCCLGLADLPCRGPCQHLPAWRSCTDALQAARLVSTAFEACYDHFDWNVNVLTWTSNACLQVGAICYVCRHLWVETNAGLLQHL